MTETPNADLTPRDVVATVADRGPSEPSTINHQPPATPKRGEGGSTVRRIVWRIVAILIGGVFIYAGALKAVDPVGFAIDIENYKILPWPIGVRLAFYLPWLEIFCGLAVILRMLHRGALGILTLSMLVFIGATMAAKVRGLDITCGCFGRASQGWSFPLHMAVDFALLAALIFLLVADRKRHEL